MIRPLFAVYSVKAETTNLNRKFGDQMDSVKNTEDEQLIQRSREGDQDAFEQLIKNYESSIYDMAWAILHDHHLAEDCRQEVFVKVYKNMKKLREPAKFRSWLATVTENQAKDIVKYEVRRPIPVEDFTLQHKIDQHSDEDSLNATMAKLADAVDTLPQNDKLLVDEWLAGESVTGLAQKWKCSQGQMSKRLKSVAKTIEKRW